MLPSDVFPAVGARSQLPIQALAVGHSVGLGQFCRPCDSCAPVVPIGSLVLGVLQFVTAWRVVGSSDCREIGGRACC